VAGKGYRYASRLEAWQALQVFLKRYPARRIDVGIAQVNLGWNGHRFPSTWAAFDPYTSLETAAVILQECRQRHPDSWLKAAGCYHHPAGGKPAARYTAVVRRHLDRLNAKSMTSQQTAMLAPAADYIWTEPRRRE
ncbi:lytic transglycosylase domain-containing protein, partial [Escherichia coli]|nr:lytic transglycosylase domain-containing protein [Escherichia coli]